MSDFLLGIDPGANTGLAIYEDGKLTELLTRNPLQTIDFIRTQWPALIVIEDSRLQSKVFSRGNQNTDAKLKIARNIGEIDAWCKIINILCEELNIPMLCISPKDKGHKLNAEDFSKITGWTGKSNQHERDASMVAWNHRNKRFTRENTNKII